MQTVLMYVIILVVSSARLCGIGLDLAFNMCSARRLGAACRELFLFLSRDTGDGIACKNRGE